MSIPTRWARPVVLAGCVLLVAGCSDDPGPTPTPVVRPSNPLDELTDPTSEEFIAQTVRTVLDEEGEGSATFTVAREEGLERVTYYVACSPASTFKLSMDERWFSGECATSFQNSGGIPAEGTGDLRVDLALPDGVAYRVVGVPEYS
ncbi:hypothetical protein [Sanguibacter suaedae]|uniref:Uncharacterized protein n=1 Tax=Sanguibacter suaedae TaxID=2795737 RepID=A0A934MAD3_9MICO|nr:hypothetical protein [Sanguibacter suaedae]MBI9115633.1 hypothetical protein [Sanguibacter suaedae]